MKRKRKYTRNPLGKNKNERYARSLLYAYAPPSGISQLKKKYFGSKGGR